MQLLTKEIRESFIDMYFQRQKLIFMVKFIAQKAKQDHSIVFDKYVQMLNKLDKKLGFKGQSNEIDQEFISKQVALMQLKKNEKNEGDPSEKKS